MEHAYFKSNNDLIDSDLENALHLPFSSYLNRQEEAEFELRNNYKIVDYIDKHANVHQFWIGWYIMAECRKSNFFNICYYDNGTLVSTIPADQLRDKAFAQFSQEK